MTVPNFNERDIVSAEVNPNKKVHRPMFVGVGKGKTWVAKRVSHRRHLKLNPKLPKHILPDTKSVEGMPKFAFDTIATGVVGFFGTGFVGTATVLGMDAAATAAKANLSHPAYGPVRDGVRILVEGIVGLKAIPWALGKYTKTEYGKAYWVGATLLTGLDLGVTVAKYISLSAGAIKSRTMPQTQAEPAATEAGLALVGLSGLAKLVKGMDGIRTPENAVTPETPMSIEGDFNPKDISFGMEGAVTDENIELQKAKARFHELSGLIQGGTGDLIRGVDGGGTMMGRLVK